MNRTILIACLLIIVSAQLILSSLPIEERIPSKQPIIQQQVPGYTNTTTSFRHGDGNEMEDSLKAQKGTGAYGGANVVHHPRPRSRAESLTNTPYYIYIFTAINICFSSTLFLVPSL